MKTTALIGSSSSTSEDGPKRSASVDINRARTPRTPADDEAFFPDRKGGASPTVPRNKSSPAVSRRSEGGSSKQHEEQNWNADLQTTKVAPNQPPMKRTQSAPHKKQNNNHNK